MSHQKAKTPAGQNAESAINHFEEWRKREKAEKKSAALARDRELAERYRKLREICHDKNHKSMTQASFAAITGIRKQIIEQMEDPKDCRSMSRASAQAYRRAIKANRNIDVSYDYLFGESDTFDIRYHNIAAYTGLSQETLEKLHDLYAETNGMISSLINLMLGDDLNLIVNLSNYVLCNPSRSIEGEITTYQINEKGKYVMEEYPLNMSPELQSKALLIQLYDNLLALKKKQMEAIEKNLSERSE